MGSAGDQILLGYWISLDPQVRRGYLNNVRVSGVLNDGDGDNGGVAYYVTTNSSWADHDIISARAFPGYGGTVNLPVRRTVSGETVDDDTGGVLYLWGEVTDLTYTTDVELRTIVETWGNFIKFVFS